jgi:NADH-quinone oxidoreductase subunit H
MFGRLRSSFGVLQNHEWRKTNDERQRQAATNHERQPQAIMIDTLVIPLLKIVIVLNATLVAVTYMVLLERKVIAWAQSRLGPMRVGPYGVLQPIADALKLMIKEDITPVRADKWVFTVAPIVAMVPALIVYAVIPFGSDVTLFGRKVTLFITDINVGLLYIVSVASVGVYGIILAGWSSNSKYPLLASLRASAQLISYEVVVTLTLVSVIMMAGTLSMVGIVNAQYDQHVWYVFAQPIAFVLVLIGGLAETNRAPFDLPEAEQELTGGFHTEYSGMRFALFFLAEYANMYLIAALTAVFFFGGWLSPFDGYGIHTPVIDIAAPSFGWLALKIFLLMFLFLWFRATFPRYRYDQIMRLGWKALIPVTLVWIAVEGVMVYYKVGPWAVTG